jgi:putative membrane protein
MLIMTMLCPCSLEEVAMGGMMGASGNWALLWGLLALVLVVAGGGLAAWTLAARRNAEPPPIHAGGSPAVRDAKDALRLRYANGEIGREEYLQGKVELED